MLSKLLFLFGAIEIAKTAKNHIEYPEYQYPDTDNLNSISFNLYKYDTGNGYGYFSTDTTFFSVCSVGEDIPVVNYRHECIGSSSHIKIPAFKIVLNIMKN